MSTEKIIEVASVQEMQSFGENIGRLLQGGEVIELAGDVGAGKTTFVKGLARGLEIDEDVQSPSFTISRVYTARNALQLAHYDFYRLNDAGIMASELSETTTDPKSITVIEWAEIVEDILPEHRLRITFTAPTETSRTLVLDGPEIILEKL
ncbi:MAG: tRNA (adenosine(37)-N6)-threonylcarbamoyltransferase complex ATPase subunit type 1 TsaE [Candidatus Microsaccharimonas sossegonensis]|uniref:tRNA threonylcarbamoyladenosine biosynthesis protein TsaE n=1 Tax=Candidatus Microsaccharimonas sossegonensis TaxID=2506948 RepID=A0A4Q0AGI1_9BACT|nr:MAG: tRNA (adenosine(37)-N6)-threonylcarbamoyltransferase complex ATPase subunit type 1 TsaE [Candidatus Microsaccharimonas sossegonensis]